MDNPLDGIIPDFTIFGAEFTQLWQKIVAGLWGIAIIFVIVFIILGVVAMARSSESNPQAYQQGKQQTLYAFIALGALVALGVIVGAIIAFFG